MCENKSKQITCVSDGELFAMASAARKFAYAPYSGYSVGAAILCDDGSIYTGCNIENATYSPGVCAERTAIFKAVSEGKRSFLKIAITGGKAGTPDGFAPPCGVCRQVIAEFCDENFIIILGDASSQKSFRLSELLPFSFTSKDLGQ